MADATTDPRDTSLKVVLLILGVACLLGFVAGLAPAWWLSSAYRFFGVLGPEDPLSNSETFWFLLRLSFVPYLGAGILLFVAAHRPRENLLIINTAWITAFALLVVCCLFGATGDVKPLLWISGAVKSAIALTLLTAVYPWKRRRPAGGATGPSPSP